MIWDQYFISMAYLVSMKSKDRSTKCGAVVVGPDHEIRSTGYNGMPRGINDDLDGRHERPLKYALTEHAERNAVFNAARMGISVSDCTIYTPYFPCVDCARAIIQSGIKRMVYHTAFEKDNMSRPQWGESQNHANMLLLESGVEIVAYDGPIIDRITGFKDGKVMAV